ncbi:hypothetical protein KPL74_10840 [Bacillus sp. NP157]|nr:hypothetical protein KPL74_10840 [Bacillus sp. NP157]
MKNRIFLLGLLVCGPTLAQVGPANLTYRDSDPFLFCTYGQDIQKNPDRCWWPLPPFTGGAAWMNAPYCEPVDPYGIPWDADDYASFEQYQTVCPVALRPGGWDSKKGQADMVPYKH